MTYRYLKNLTLFIFLLMVPSTAALSQEAYPREYRPDEYVTFDRSLPMKTALNILSGFSSRFEGRIIIDPDDHTAPIGIVVNNMYWKRALEYILRSNLLQYIEHEKYYEVVPLGAGPESKEEIEKVDTYTREIEINAIFFEADYQALMEAGINWSFIRSGKVGVNSNFGSEVSKDLFSVEYSDHYRLWDIFALLRTFESADKGEIIANPQIKVMEGEEGKIKVGTNFFLTTRDFAGNTRFTEYEAGIILTVIPYVLGTKDSLFIHLDINAERSTVFPDPVNVTKAITESKTQVLLLNGEETVIAGLFSNEARNVRRGIPFLKDLPPWFFGLRYLFGYTSQELKKKELIILLQANIVPTIAQRIGMRLGQRNYLEEKRQEFKRRLRQLKDKNSFNSSYRNGASSLRNNGYESYGSNFYYGVEVGSFAESDQAIKASQDYQTRGYQVGVLKQNDQYKLLVGAYESQQDAERLADFFSGQDGGRYKVMRYKHPK